MWSYSEIPNYAKQGIPNRIWDGACWIDNQLRDVNFSLIGIVFLGVGLLALFSQIEEYGVIFGDLIDGLNTLIDGLNTLISGWS